MVKLKFNNAIVSDSGFGIRVNGNSLEDVISMALGVKSSKAQYKDVTPFNSNCCNVTVIIDPQPATTCIETDDYIWGSVENMEEDMYELKKTQKTDAEK